MASYPPPTENLEIFSNNWFASLYIQDLEVVVNRDTDLSVDQVSSNVFSGNVLFLISM